jgi:hypothetical protein
MSLLISANAFPWLMMSCLYNLSSLDIMAKLPVKVKTKIQNEATRMNFP